MLSPATTDKVWQSGNLAKLYLDNVRGAIPLAAEQLDLMLRLLRTGPQPIRRFLDLGCGDGVLGAAVLTAYPQAHGVFVDFSAPMLDACRQRLRNHAGPVTVLELDYGLPAWREAVMAHAPFDAIVSGFSIHHQPDARKQQLYREIHDLLEPGGWFVHLEHCAPGTATAHRLFEETFVDNIHALLTRQGRPADRDAIRREFVNRADQQANILAPIEAQCAWLRAIGFVEADCYLKIHELAVFGGRRAG